MKAFYIYSFRADADYEEFDYDWFVGEDLKEYGDQRELVAKHIVDSDYAEDIKEAQRKLKDVYKQDTKVLIAELKETK